MQNTTVPSVGASLNTLPSDDLRQIMWRFADRYELQMLVQGSRSVARGPVARLVAEGARNSHEWTPEKASLLPAFDESGITAACLDPDQGGFIEGPKNLALALVAFELSWVDAGAATSSLAGNLGLAPIHERGTPEQYGYFYGGAVTNWGAWQVSSYLGIIIGGLFPTEWGFELAASLALVAVRPLRTTSSFFLR